MKRFLSMALVLALSFALLPTGIVGLQVCAETVDSLPYLTYTITDNKVTITDCDTSFSGELVIPSAIENYPVTAIGSYAFENCDGITAVTIPTCVKCFGDFAFSGCVNVQSVYISDLSQWCAIKFDGPRYGYGNRYTDLTANPLSYGADLYVNGEKVTDLVFPQDVTEVSDMAFCGCRSLQSVTIHGGVTSVGESAFNGCENIERVYVDNLTHWLSIDFGFGRIIDDMTNDPTANPLCYGADLYFGGELVTELVIPPDVNMNSKEFAFYGCGSLQSVVILNTTTGVGSYTFANCDNITSVALARAPYTEFSGGFAVFESCDNITDVWIREVFEENTLASQRFWVGDSSYSFDSITFHINACISAEGASKEHQYNSSTNLCDVCGCLPYSGWTHEGDQWVYYQHGSKVYNRWVKDGDEWLYIGADGYIVTDAWIRDSAGWCYVDSDGYCLTSQWKRDSKGLVYLGADGRMATNRWLNDGNGWLYVGSDGYIKTNAWARDSKGWCYLGADGRVVKNAWVRDSVSWCYVDGDGYCVTDQWKRDSKGWVYLGANGRMVTNQWFRDVSGWLYLGADGYIKTNAWQKDSRGWCYLDGNGRMVTNTYVRDSRGLCYINSAGYWDGKYR